MPSTAAPSFPCFTYCPFKLTAAGREQRFWRKAETAPQTVRQRGNTTGKKRAETGGSLSEGLDGRGEEDGRGRCGGRGRPGGRRHWGQKARSALGPRWRGVWVVGRSSPGVELFLGCFGAVYWKDSLA